MGLMLHLRLHTCYRSHADIGTDVRNTFYLGKQIQKIRCSRWICQLYSNISHNIFLHPQSDRLSHLPGPP